MCGIAGILKFDQNRIVERSRLRRMCETLQHRGPDDDGIACWGTIGLGHRRLTIIDAETGQQPMCDATRKVWITYNGEIYNFQELRKRLEVIGHTFRTRSDTEVILHAYDQFGEDCVRHLRGMFAFAIWDGHRRKLFLARDRLGIKPLYFSCTRDELLFASEIKGILAVGETQPELNKNIIPEFLANRYITGQDTFFVGISKLLPGCTLSWTEDVGVRQHRYWALPDNLVESKSTLEECGLETRLRLEDSIRCHLISDVPVGLFLSGGLDSSGLAALMADMVETPLRSFSVGFAERECNELQYARRVANALHTEHYDTLVAPESFFEILPTLIWHEDEPIAFPSSVPLYFVSKLASNHVKVVMTGEGADELFLGYNRYRVTAWNHRLGNAYSAVVPGRMRNRIAGIVDRLPRPLQRYIGRSFLASTQEIRDLFCENFAVFSEALQRNLLQSMDISSGRDPYAENLRCYNAAPGGILERMGYSDLQTYLVELLMKQDQMSMAASVESRVPFLDHNFVEYAAALPARYKVRGWNTKAALRAALRGRVPEEILTRRKMGFPVPIGRWFRDGFSPFIDEFVLGARALDRGLFNPEVLQRMVNEHRAGQWNHADRLWLLLNLELWQRIFLDGERPENLLNHTQRDSLRIAA